MPNCLSAARILDELMMKLIETGADIPLHVTDDLKSGRSLASISARQPDDDGISAKTLPLLENAEMNLLALADIHLGREAAEKWQRRINTAYHEQQPPVIVSPVSRMASGIPRGDHWIRVKADYLDTVDGAKELLEGYAVTVITQEDGYMLIHGRKEDVSAFLSEIRERQKSMA